MKKNHLKKGLMLIATSVFVLALPVLASAKSALDDYVGKWNIFRTPAGSDISRNSRPHG